MNSGVARKSALLCGPIKPEALASEVGGGWNVPAQRRLLKTVKFSAMLPLPWVLLERATPERRSGIAEADSTLIFDENREKVWDAAWKHRCQHL